MCSRTARRGRDETGPGACASAAPSIACTGCTSRSDDAEERLAGGGEVVAAS